jgi:hypothetical protein
VARTRPRKTPSEGAGAERSTNPEGFSGESSVPSVGVAAGRPPKATVGYRPRVGRSEARNGSIPEPISDRSTATGVTVSTTRRYPGRPTRQRMNLPAAPTRTAGTEGTWSFGRIKARTPKSARRPASVGSNRASAPDIRDHVGRVKPTPSASVSSNHAYAGTRPIQKTLEGTDRSPA